MNEVESLELITSMINDSRARMGRDFGTPFLIWGYTTVLVSIIQALIVAFVDDFMPYLWLWCAIPLIGWPLMLCLNRQERGAVNYIDRCVGAVWTGIGIASVFIPFYCGFGISVFSTVVVLMGTHGRRSKEHRACWQCLGQFRSERPSPPKPRYKWVESVGCPSHRSKPRCP